MRLWFTHRNTCTIRNINTSVNTLQHYPITVKQKAGLITPSLWTFWSVTWLSSESAFVLLRLLEFSELPRFLLPLCYCVDQIIPGHKNTPGSDSPGVQVMSVVSHSTCLWDELSLPWWEISFSTFVIPRYKILSIKIRAIKERYIEIFFKAAPKFSSLSSNKLLLT